MMVEKVPDSTYEMVGGLDKQIKEIKEVTHVDECLFVRSCVCFSSTTLFLSLLVPKQMTE